MGSEMCIRDSGSLEPVYEDLFSHLKSWFEDRVNQYDHGNYGTMDIGFDIQRVED